MITTIICVITITTSGQIPFIVKTQAEGVLIKESNVNYLIDFSKKAKELNWQGDYSKVLVKKEDCIK